MRLVVLPDYQGIGLGKRLLTFIAELYTSQMNLPFYLVTSNPQLVRATWKAGESNVSGTAQQDNKTPE
jgi:GNAT superfamily N-acetyltransferase